METTVLSLVMAYRSSGRFWQARHPPRYAALLTQPSPSFGHSSKNRIMLEHYYLPGHLKAQVAAFVEHYNHQRHHESLGNLTPADVYFGRGQAILRERERINRHTIQQRRLLHQRQAA
jgi:hypothetical protein